MGRSHSVTGAAVDLRRRGHDRADHLGEPNVSWWPGAVPGSRIRRRGRGRGRGRARRAGPRLGLLEGLPPASELTLIVEADNILLAGARNASEPSPHPRARSSSGSPPSRISTWEPRGSACIGTIIEKPTPTEPHPIRATRAALRELGAWARAWPSSRVTSRTRQGERMGDRWQALGRITRTGGAPSR